MTNETKVNKNNNNYNNYSYLKDDKDYFAKKRMIEKRKNIYESNIFNCNLTKKSDQKTYSFYFGEKNEDYYIKHANSLNKTHNSINRTKKMFNYKNDYNSIIKQLNNNLDTNYRTNSVSASVSTTFKRNNSSLSPFDLMKSLYNQKSSINNYSNQKYNERFSPSYTVRKDTKNLPVYNSPNSRIFNKFKKVKTAIFPANPFDPIY